MSDRRHPGPAGGAELSEQDLAVAALVGRYIERREHHETPCVHDLLAAAAEFGDSAVDVLRTVLACYEAMRAYDDADPCPSANRAASAAEVRSTLIYRFLTVVPTLVAGLIAAATWKLGHRPATDRERR